MTKDEFLHLKDQYHQEYECRVKELGRRFALSNNPYKIGDVIKDHIGKGKIEDIKVYKKFFNDIWECQYTCINLTKKDTVNKREPKRYITQSNIED